MLKNEVRKLRGLFGEKIKRLRSELAAKGSQEQEAMGLKVTFFKKWQHMPADYDIVVIDSSVQLIYK